MRAITTAGLDAPSVSKPTDRKRELLRGIRQVLRRSEATEDEDLDALEALVLLSKED